MKYNEIIHINENFVPVFDLENEEENYWSLFIPNDNFRHILRAVIDSLITIVFILLLLIIFLIKL